MIESECQRHPWRNLAKRSIQHVPAVHCGHRRKLFCFFPVVDYEFIDCEEMVYVQGKDFDEELEV